MGSMRFGLVGTGHWARLAYAPALASAEGIDFVSVWGRGHSSAAEVAGGYGAAAYDDFGEFLGSVDGVAFAVPPDVQSELATAAAAAGKHLLLEKPVALTSADADRLVAAVMEAGVASVVFFTAQFQPDVRAWLADARARGGWLGGAGTWLGTAFQEGNPFNTPWRREKGGLWDVGPHLVALLIKGLGPVTSVTARKGPADVTHLVLGHEGGASSTVTATLSANESSEFSEVYLWGESGRSVAPAEYSDPVPPLRTALSELAANAAAGRTEHPCDVRFGRDVVDVLAAAADQA
ncbi:MAG TPA: Gfo/Idh/MocA family oxidoreductase [Streptosporangiaceae bacterium]|nr:Gfo/Idh/MocA family oxidoreductase [Streptosporangiaceae bacterium]